MLKDKDLLNKWVLFSNGKRKQITHITRYYYSYRIDFKFNSKPEWFAFYLDGRSLKGASYPNIVSVWDTKPSRKEIMATIRLGSLISQKAVQQPVFVTELKINNNKLDYPYRVNGYTYSEKGRYLLAEKGRYDIVAVDNRALTKED